jgi:cyclic beta-1,2-glucan synthetase
MHGLPLIGSHDWNDALNRVGIKGKGESIWLGWFLYANLMDFSALCERIGDSVQRNQRQARNCAALIMLGWRMVPAHIG